MILLPERGPVEEVTVTGPEPDTVDCTAPVKFEATARTSISPLIKPTLKRLRRRYWCEACLGIKITGDQTLVIDEPNRKKGSVSYNLTCKGTDSE